MLKRLLAGSVLGTTVLVFSSAASFGDSTTRLENRLRYDLQLLTALDHELTVLEEHGAPAFLDRLVTREINTEENKAENIECKLGHCGVSDL